MAQRTLRETMVSWFTDPLGRSPRRGPRSAWFWALKDAAFEVAPGEAVGLIGPNGAGKSTLLKLLSRITYPTEGRAVLNGRVGSLLEVGTGFHPELTGRENIFLSGTILGMKRAEVRSRLAEIVAFAELERFLDTPVKHYSSGMYVRLGFAVAAHLDPEILLVDEVLAVGDAAFQQRCLGKMNEVAHGGRTILFVSHNLEAVQRLCGRSLYLNDGVVRFIGPSREAIERYLSDIRGGVHGSIWHASDCPIAVEGLRIGGQPPEKVRVWGGGEPLPIELDLVSSAPTGPPAVDVSFLRVDGVRLFTLTSGSSIACHPAGRRATRWHVTVRCGRLPVTAQRVYFDIGVSRQPGSEYVLVWNRAAEFEVLPPGDSPALVASSVVWLPATIEVEPA